MYIRNTFSIYRRMTSFVAPRRAAHILIDTIQKSRHVQTTILLTCSFRHNGLLRVTLHVYWEKCPYICVLEFSCNVTHVRQYLFSTTLVQKINTGI